MAAEILIQFTQQRLGSLPADAGIRHRDAVFHRLTRLFRGLIAFVDITFDHQADNGAVAIFDLRDHGFSHGRLAAEIFIGVPMTAIYHQRRLQSRLRHLFFAFRHIFRTVVRRLAAAEDHMAVRITLRLQQADLPGLVDADETVRHRRGAHGVDGRSRYRRYRF